MSNHQYDTNNDIVRYQGTYSEFTDEKKEEERRNDFYDFDVELSETLNNFRKRFNNKDIVLSNNDNFTSDKRDYSNNSLDIDFLCSGSLNKDNNINKKNINNTINNNNNNDNNKNNINNNNIDINNNLLDKPLIILILIIIY